MFRFTVRRCSVVAVALMFMAVPSWVRADPPVASVPVPNGGFEHGSEGWGGAGKFAVVGEEKHAGLKSLLLSSGYLYQEPHAGQMIAVDPKFDYRITVWIKTDQCDEQGVSVMAMARGGAGPDDIDQLGGWLAGTEPAYIHDNGQSPALIATGGSHDWTKFETSIPSSQLAKQAHWLHLYLRHDRNNSPVGKAYFDDVTVERLPAGTVVLKQVTLNGGFESGQTGWWGDAYKNNGAAVVNDSPAEGKACLKLPGGWVAQDKRPVSGGTNYRLSMKIRSEAAPEGATYVQVSFRGAGIAPSWFGPVSTNAGGATEAAAFVDGGTHDWKEFTTVIQAPTGSDQVLVYLRKKANSDGAAYFDDIRLEPTEDKPVTAADVKLSKWKAEWLPSTQPTGDAGAAVAAVVKGGAEPSPAQLTIAQNAAARYSINVGTQVDLITLGAGVELADCLNKITGASFKPMSWDASPAPGPMIVIGRENELTKKLCPDIPYDRLGRDGFVIRTVGPHLIIAGATPRGTLYGVYWFLDRHLGVKWFSPEYTVIPSKPVLELAPINEEEVPRFTYREMFSWDGDNDRYAAHNLLNGRSHGRSFWSSPAEIDSWESWWNAKGTAAQFYDLLPQNKFAKTHGDWYAGGQLSMMNPQLRQAMADEVVARLKQLSDYKSTFYQIIDMDWGWDMDPASKAFADQHGGQASAPRLDMMINVADRVRQVLPDAKLAFNAYHWSFTPPTSMRVPNYLLVNPMTIHVDYSAPLNQGPNLKLGQDLAAWAKISKNVLVWDHTINFFGYLQPTPNLYNMLESIQWLGTLDSVMGYFAEDSWETPGAEFSTLRTWAASRLLWDPKQDYKAVVSEFLAGYYGPAAPYVQQYIDAARDSMVKTGDTFREKTTPSTPYLSFEFLSQADKLMEQAEAAVGDNAVFLKNVQTLRLSVDYTILVRRADFADRAKALGVAWDPDTQNRTERLFRNYKQAKVKQFYQGGSLAQLKDLVAIERKVPADVPDLVKGLAPSDWVDYQDLCFTCYDRTQHVADPAASDGGAIRTAGNSSTWAVQFRRFKLPKEGEWDLYAAVRAERNGGADKDVAAHVGSAPPMGRFTTVTLGEIGDGQYHLIKVAGSPFKYEFEDEKIVYVQPPSSSKVKYVYVDRIIAIRHKP